MSIKILSQGTTKYYEDSGVIVFVNTNLKFVVRFDTKDSTNVVILDNKETLKLPQVKENKRTIFNQIYNILERQQKGSIKHKTLQEEKNNLIF